ncbi:hypothetical protein JCM19300_1199 [Algibacter lectus]|uniref:Uncharacterized protein n=1 Tax=Algibacter lectus TaxID=221126 RepID=A0A090W6M0_9FLAO|nr:hypothetical protein JCM19300_1199 [Algibacter lectus]
MIVIVEVIIFNVLLILKVRGVVLIIFICLMRNYFQTDNRNN